ncbi:hypothetical protein BDD12DRAFT_882149 [Trichophaea hybrida]|nr:hypothetical protein BDD12DRAFT_882149 [Trichophaea hybrida]
MPPKRAAPSTSSSTSKRSKPTPPAVVTAGKSILTLASSTPANSDLILTSQQAWDLVAYTLHLESSSSTPGPAELSTSELNQKVSQLQGLVARGIEKLLKWKPSCKTSSATYSFEGICADPRVMAKMLGVEDATRFKAKKYTVEQFQDYIVEKSVYGNSRYTNLYLCGNVNLRWNHETGEYKWSGKYGISR